MIETYKKDLPDSIEENFGFRPTVWISLELTRGQNPAFYEGARDRLRVVDWLLHNIEGDGVLLANYDLPVLMRRDGKVWLDHEDRFWRPQDIGLITVPHEWKTLPKY